MTEVRKDVPDPDKGIRDFMATAAPVAQKATRYAPILIILLVFNLGYGCIACTTDVMNLLHVRQDRSTKTVARDLENISDSLELMQEHLSRIGSSLENIYGSE